MSTYIIMYLLIIHSLSAMQMAFSQSNKAVVGSQVLTHVFGVKTWLSPFLEELHHHTQPHIFKFSLNTEQKAEMRYKKWSHMDWEEEPVILLKVSKLLQGFS